MKTNHLIFKLNTQTYPLEAIYSTAYVFLDRAYVYLDGNPKKEIIVSLKGKEKLNEKQIESLKGEFHNELLNYILRAEIAKRNQKVRDFIVGTALLSALPQESPVKTSKPKTITDQNYLRDPLNITVPWEEKQGKYKKKTKKENKKCK
jgi:His-Xaa-Ser system protein HxsD